jgi:hypothetical protein
MAENDEDRARAVECLRKAKDARDETDMQSWLALAESWLQTVQLRQTGEQKFQLTEEAKFNVLKWATTRSG